MNEPVHLDFKKDIRVEALDDLTWEVRVGAKVRLTAEVWRLTDDYAVLGNG